MERKNPFSLLLSCSAKPRGKRGVVPGASTWSSVIRQIHECGMLSSVDVWIVLPYASLLSSLQ